MKAIKPWLLLAALLLSPGIAIANREPAMPQDQETLRSQLLRDYGITVLDKTDEHAPVVLQNFLFLLQHGFTADFIRSLKNVRYLYAYSGHDRHYNLGAFHEEAKAISIGGKSAYPEKIGKPDIQIITTLAHEIGHAFLLGKMSPLELRRVGEKFGGWAEVFGKDFVSGFYAKEFFAPHPGLSDAEREKNNICSRLAKNNIHEWFADAFAAVILQHLGKEGLLGSNWREKIVNSPRNPKDYWTNYNLVSTSFSGWLEQKMKIRQSHLGASLSQL